MSPVERSEKFGALVGGDANVMVGNLKANQVLSLGADANMDFKSQPARPSCPNRRERGSWGPHGQSRHTTCCVVEMPVLSEGPGELRPPKSKWLGPCGADSRVRSPWSPSLPAVLTLLANPRDRMLVNHFQS